MADVTFRRAVQPSTWVTVCNDCECIVMNTSSHVCSNVLTLGEAHVDPAVEARYGREFIEKVNRIGPNRAIYPLGRPRRPLGASQPQSWMDWTFGHLSGPLNAVFDNPRSHTRRWLAKIERHRAKR